MGGEVGGVAKGLATAACTTDIRYCSLFCADLEDGAVVAVSTFMDWLNFCISAATCFETSVEICLDHVVLSVPRDFLVNNDLCASGLFCRHLPSS